MITCNDECQLINSKHFARSSSITSLALKISLRQANSVDCFCKINVSFFPSLLELMK